MLMPLAWISKIAQPFQGVEHMCQNKNLIDELQKNNKVKMYFLTSSQSLDQRLISAIGNTQDLQCQRYA